VYAWKAESSRANSSTLDEESLEPSPGPSSSSRKGSDSPHDLSSPGLSSTSLASEHSAESRRTLELGLMHQWSTETYKSLCCIPDDNHYLQVVLPREGLQHEYLLNGVLALSALHLARSAPEAEARMYVNAALEYYGLASGPFRAQLGTITAENHHLVFIFSVLVVMINLAMPQSIVTDDDQRTAIRRTVVTFDLLNSALFVAMTGWQWLLDSPVPLRQALELGRASLDILTDDTRAAFARLNKMNDDIHGLGGGGGSGSSLLGGLPEELAGEPAASHQSYAKVIKILEYCYAEDARAVMEGYCIAFPGAAGQSFSSALSRSEHLAMLVLMHWAVLLDRLDQKFWWAQGMGTRLVVELSNILHTSDHGSMPEWMPSITWVQQQMAIHTLQ
jgi:hypothetical protein